jgi:hypothetical protein
MPEVVESEFRARPRSPDRAIRENFRTTWPAARATSGGAGPRCDRDEHRRMAKAKRAWVTGAEIGERVGWAMREATERIEREPWAAVVLHHVAVEVGLAAVVHWLTNRQEPALRAWIEQMRLDTFKRPEELALLNALLAGSGDRINADEQQWAAFIRHINRRNDFLHKGAIPSAAKARESQQACEWF